MSQTDGGDSRESESGGEVDTETDGQDSTETGAEGSTETGDDDSTETGDELCGLVCHDPIVIDGIETCHSPESGFSSRYNRLHGGGPFDPTISAPGCQGDEQNIECTMDAECNSGQHGKCIRGSTFGGTWCRCAYSCSTDADCSEGTLCVPPLGSQNWPSCAPATCKGPEDCECGECGVGWLWICSGTAFAVQCRTEDDYCHDYDQCDFGVCYPSEEGPWNCHYQEC